MGGFQRKEMLFITGRPVEEFVDWNRSFRQQYQYYLQHNGGRLFILLLNSKSNIFFLKIPIFFHFMRAKFVPRLMMTDPDYQ